MSHSLEKFRLVCFTSAIRRCAANAGVRDRGVTIKADTVSLGREQSISCHVGFTMAQVEHVAICVVVAALEIRARQS